MTTYYLAGPMRGYPRFNFDAFELAEADLQGRGFAVISPHRMDLDIGFNPDSDSLEGFDLKDCIRRDTEAILKSDGLVFLSDWKRSKGAVAERGIAKWLDLPCLSYPDLSPIMDEDILEEAMRLTSHERNDAYGPPNQDFSRTAKMWSAILGHDIDAKDVALCMIALKMSRATWASKRDNWVDIAGYARCGAMIENL